MSLPDPIRQSIRNAIITSGNSFYSQNPDPYIDPLEEKIISLVNGFVNEARRDSTSNNCFEKKMKDCVVLTGSNKEIITTIFEKILRLKCHFALQLNNTAPMEESVHREIFKGDLRRYELTIVWEPKNPVMKTYNSIRDFFVKQEAFQYSVETHLDVLQQQAKNGIRTDVMFQFSYERIIPVHSFMLLAYASPKLVEDVRSNNHRYKPEIYETIIQFIYTGKLPILTKNNVTTLSAIRDAAQYYEIQALFKWSSIEFDKTIKTSIDPEKNFAGYFQLACEYNKEDMLKICFKMAENSQPHLKELLSKLTLANYDYVSETVGVETPLTMKGILSQRRHLGNSEISGPTNVGLPSSHLTSFNSNEIEDHSVKL